MRTLVFGKNGQIAQSLKPYFPEAIFLGSNDANFERPQRVLEKLNEIKPCLIINASAYTEVDKAEIEPGKAQIINAETPFEIADWCKVNKASLIHYSTDYVYQGSGTDPWSETSKVDPLNRYGQTKLAGEREIQSTGCHAIILRTSWVYSPVGKNFVKTMCNLAKERDVLRIVNDQVGSPTYAPDIAQCTKQIVNHSLFGGTSGVFNLANTGCLSWFEFSVSIFSALRRRGVLLRVSDVEPISSSQFPTPAKRPLNSRMDTSKIENIFGIKLRSWEEALEDCLSKLAEDGTI